MPAYQLQIKQVVDYPRCRIYRQFVHRLMADRSIRTSGGSGLFYFTVLCSYANFRTSYRRIDGISYTIYPGEWVCTLKEVSQWFRTRFQCQALTVLEQLQKQHFITFHTLDRGNVIRYKICDWARHNTVLEYNAPCQKDTGFFFLPVSVVTDLISTSRCSEMDIILDLWVSAVYNDNQVQGSDLGPVVYFRNGTGNPLVAYTELAVRWGVSRATVGRVLKKLAALDYSQKKGQTLMAEEQKNSSAETVDAAASAAHTVKGAIKAGKAISGAAKGAAAAGPYGAVAGAVWAGRKHIGKIIAVIAILLLLPVLFLLMLPGLIFGGLVNAFSPADPDTPILNSETAIVENANDITFAINAILGEALDDVMARIEVDFASSGADKMEVKNPYSSGLVYNANLIVSQYCAARDEDFESISLDDLSTVLRENKEHLYSYTSVRESREVTSEDPETGEETISTEIWMIYTIRYNGESYLADHVFALTDEQKELASDYASNLSLFLGDGLLQNVDEWTGNSIPSLGDVTFTDGGTPVVYYNQLDERYASQPYGTDNIGGYGCGPTAMAIVVSSLTDDMVDPVEMAKWSYDNGYWCKSSGSYHALIPAAAEEWGLPVSGCTTSEPQRILDALADGKLVVAIMSEGHFTSSGHFIVLRGVKDGQIMVADPASYKRSGQLWDLSIILNEASRRAAAGGPFWIIG